MKILGLISGGKDSIFNMMHCIAHGHSIVALAHLSPPSTTSSLSNSEKNGSFSGEEFVGHEMDSYMYQSVGSNIVPLIAECLDLPLYSRTLQGASICTQLIYPDYQSAGTQSKIDEVEDLYYLVENILSHHHQDIEAISVGAILSTYQRVRVESVARRLGLKVLAFLWHQDQSFLVQSMIDTQLEAILIKTATIGLNASHLGQSIVQLYPTLVHLNKKWGVNIAGEGGEYESLVLDCPLFKKKKLQVEESVVVAHSLGLDCSAFYLKIIRASLVDKRVDENDGMYQWQILLKRRFDVPLSLPLTDQKREEESSRLVAIRSPSKMLLGESWKIQWSIQDDPSGKYFLMNAPILPMTKRSSLSLPQQAKYLINALTSHMKNHQCLWEFVVFVQIQISDMDAFESVNQIYAKYVASHWPPSRVTIQMPLETLASPAISIFGFGWIPGTGDLEQNINLDRLFVSSISYWAPANIGPYSQMTRIPSRTEGPGLFILSGMIGLVPSSMSLPLTLSDIDSSFDHQWVYLWRHEKAILDAIGSACAETLIQIGYVTKSYHVAKARNKLMALINFSEQIVGKNPMLTSTFEEEKFQNHSWRTLKNALLVLVVVSRLPRDALVEWQLIQNDPVKYSTQSMSFMHDKPTYQGVDHDPIEMGSYRIYSKTIRRTQWDFFTHCHCSTSALSFPVLQEDEQSLTAIVQLLHQTDLFSSHLPILSIKKIQLFLRQEISYADFADRLTKYLNISEDFPICYTPILDDGEGTLYHLLFHYR